MCCRIAFGTALVSSIAIVWLAIIVIMSSKDKDNDNNRSQSGGSSYNYNSSYGANGSMGHRWPVSPSWVLGFGAQNSTTHASPPLFPCFLSSGH
jgi:hypothetical protein